MSVVAFFKKNVANYSGSDRRSEVFSRVMQFVLTIYSKWRNLLAKDVCKSDHSSPKFIVIVILPLVTR